MQNEMLSFFRGVGFHEELCVLLTLKKKKKKEVKKKINDCSLGYMGYIPYRLLEGKKCHTALKSSSQGTFGFIRPGCRYNRKNIVYLQA